jgi:hypothetical protein
MSPSSDDAFDAPIADLTPPKGYPSFAPKPELFALRERAETLLDRIDEALDALGDIERAQQARAMLTAPVMPRKWGESKRLKPQ